MASGKAKAAIVINLVNQFIFLIPLIVNFGELWGEIGLFLALPASDLLGIMLSGT